jgi:hypothetical protein
MKVAIFSLVVPALFIIGAIASNEDTASEREVSYKECLNVCLDFEEPGYALRSCVAQCRKKYELSGDEKYCNTYEDDCDRDNDGDVWQGL